MAAPPSTGLDDCLRMLLAGLRRRMSDLVLGEGLQVRLAELLLACGLSRLAAAGLAHVGRHHLDQLPDLDPRRLGAGGDRGLLADGRPELAVDLAADPGANCIKIGLPGKSILSKRKGLPEVVFS